MIDVIRNAAAMGAAGAAVGLALQFGRGWMVAVPAIVVSGALAVNLGVLRPNWAVESLVLDAPWSAAGILAVWTMVAVAAAGWVRLDGWVVAVVSAALLGDRFVAIALAAGVEDPSRRARLVLAASGASLMGPAAGAGMVAIGGWSGALAAVGLAAACVGFVPAVGGVRRALPAPSSFLRRAFPVALTPMLGAVVVWLLILSGLPDLLAYGIEHLPALEPTSAPMILGAGAAVAGIIADEGTMALFARELLIDGRSLHGDWAHDALLVGLSLGGGLPLLLLTRSRLRVGIPLWFVQLAIGAGWLWSRSAL